MRDHLKTLGWMFVVWGVLQAVGGVAAFGLAEPGPGPRWLVVVTALFGLLAYAYVGRGLMRHDPRQRMPAILLSILALLSFPVGTVLGGYALYVLLKRRELAR